MNVNLQVRNIIIIIIIIIIMIIIIFLARKLWEIKVTVIPVIFGTITSGSEKSLIVLLIISKILAYQTIINELVGSIHLFRLDLQIYMGIFDM